MADLSTLFTGIRFENPFLLASAPPTESELDHAIGPNVIRGLLDGMTAFLERRADRGWTRLEDFRGLRRGFVVPHSQIARPNAAANHGGYQDEEAEGYAVEAPVG